MLVFAALETGLKIERFFKVILGILNGTRKQMKRRPNGKNVDLGPYKVIIRLLPSHNLSSGLRGLRAKRGSSQLGRLGSLAG